MSYNLRLVKDEKVKNCINIKNRIVFSLVGLIAAFALVLSGCNSEEEYYETEIVIDKYGQITENIVETFDKDYYNADELQQEFVNAISEYNNSYGSEEIKLKSFEVADGCVFVTLNFTGPSDYENFTNEEMFVGSINDAYDNGYTMDVSLKGIENGDIIGKVQVMGMKDRDIIILSEPVKVKTYKDIAYVSANVDPVGKREARILGESGGLAYIVLK